MSSKVLISENILTNIANAIREKSGKTEQLKPTGMASEISALSGGTSANINKVSPIPVSGYVDSIYIDITRDPTEAVPTLSKIKNWHVNGEIRTSLIAAYILDNRPVGLVVMRSDNGGYDGGVDIPGAENTALYYLYNILLMDLSNYETVEWLYTGCIDSTDTSLYAPDLIQRGGKIEIKAELITEQIANQLGFAAEQVQENNNYLQAFVHVKEKTKQPIPEGFVENICFDKTKSIDEVVQKLQHLPVMALGTLLGSIAGDYEIFGDTNLLIGLLFYGKEGLLNSPAIYATLNSSVFYTIEVKSDSFTGTAWDSNNGWNENLPDIIPINKESYLYLAENDGIEDNVRENLRYYIRYNYKEFSDILYTTGDSLELTKENYTGITVNLSPDTSHSIDTINELDKTIVTKVMVKPSSSGTVNLNKKRIGKPINPNEVAHTLYFNDWLTDEELADILIREFGDAAKYYSSNNLLFNPYAVLDSQKRIICIVAINENYIGLMLPHKELIGAANEGCMFMISLTDKTYSWYHDIRPPFKMNLEDNTLGDSSISENRYLFSYSRLSEILSFNEPFQEIDLTEEEKQEKQVKYFESLKPNTVVIEEEDETSPLLGNQIDVEYAIYASINHSLSTEKMKEIIDNIDMTNAKYIFEGIGKGVVYLAGRNGVVAVIENFNSVVNEVLGLPDENAIGLQGRGLVITFSDVNDNSTTKMLFYTVDGIPLSSLSGGMMPDFSAGWYLANVDTFEIVPFTNDFIAINLGNKRFLEEDPYYGDPKDLTEILSFNKPFSHKRTKKIVTLNPTHVLVRNSNTSETHFEVGNTCNIFLNEYLSIAEATKFAEMFPSNTEVLEIKLADKNGEIHTRKLSFNTTYEEEQRLFTMNVGDSSAVSLNLCFTKENGFGPFILFASLFIRSDLTITEITSLHENSDVIYNFISPVPFEDTGYSIVEKEEDSGEEEINVLKTILDDTKNVGSTFNNLTFEDVSHLIKYEDTANVTNMYRMFYYCRKLKTIPQLNTSNVTDMNSMFYSCSKLESIPELDTSNVTDMNQMFAWCSAITSIPQLNTSNVTNMTYMFNRCSNLTTIPQLNTSNVTTMNGMFIDCTSLVTIPQLDTSNVTNMSQMFSSCARLETVRLSDISNVADMPSTFNNCYRLTKLIIYNLTKIPPLSTNSFNKCYHFTGEVHSTYNPEGLKDGRIYVPDAMVEELKVATNWSVYADCIVPLSTLEE